MNEIMISNAQPTDYRYIIDVVDAWWGGRRMADMLPKLFFVHFQPTSFVAKVDGRIVGFVVGFVSQTFPDEAYIHFVGIRPDFRKNGLGKMLYEKFFSAVAQHGCRQVSCVTSPVNQASIAFHLHMGFVAQQGGKVVEGISVAEDYDGKGEDRVVFSKSLAR